MTNYLRRFSHYDTHINLMGGEVYYGKKPALVWTVLGSCLAIIFYSRKLKYGAIAHAQLPEPKRDDLQCDISTPVKCRYDSPDSQSYKYVSCTFHRMDETFRNLGMKKREIEVKIFGGANVIRHSRHILTVGEQNVEMALKQIRNGYLNLVSRDTGGTIGRTIYFCTDTGEVFLRKHRKVPLMEIEKAMENIEELAEDLNLPIFKV